MLEKIIKTLLKKLVKFNSNTIVWVMDKVIEDLREEVEIRGAKVNNLTQQRINIDTRIDDEKSTIELCRKHIKELGGR